MGRASSRNGLENFHLLLQEMMGLAYFLLDQSRKEAESCMENAFTTYLVCICLPSFSTYTAFTSFDNIQRDNDQEFIFYPCHNKKSRLCLVRGIKIERKCKIPK